MKNLKEIFYELKSRVYGWRLSVLDERIRRLDQELDVMEYISQVNLKRSSGYFKATSRELRELERRREGLSRGLEGITYAN